MYKTISQVALSVLVFTSCIHSTGNVFNAKASTKSEPAAVTTASGLHYRILKAGTGERVSKSDKVLFYETVSYVNGKELYSTRKTDQPLATYFGMGQLIKGVEEGLVGMQVGEIRELIIPPALSQRSDYPFNIAPDSTLIYVIELKAFGVHKWYKETRSGSQPEQAGC